MTLYSIVHQQHGRRSNGVVKFLWNTMKSRIILDISVNSTAGVIQRHSIQQNVRQFKMCQVVKLCQGKALVPDGGYKCLIVHVVIHSLAAGATR